MKVDITGINEFEKAVIQEVKEGMKEAARAGVDYAKERGSYQNHTFNLRSAPGSAVVINGEIIDMYIPSEEGHSKAKEKTENLLIYGERPQNGILIADGMEYASFVESKGYDVISGGAIEAEAKAKKTFTK